MVCWKQDIWAQTVFSKLLAVFKCFPQVSLTDVCMHSSFYNPHLLSWDWRGPAGADNELGVETVQASACRHGHRHPDWFIRQSVCVFDCVSVSIKIVCSDTLSLLKVLLSHFGLICCRIHLLKAKARTGLLIEKKAFCLGMEVPCSGAFVGLGY